MFVNKSSQYDFGKGGESVSVLYDHEHTIHEEDREIYLCGEIEGLDLLLCTEGILSIVSQVVYLVERANER
jgi:hypothetical protein